MPKLTEPSKAVSSIEQSYDYKDYLGTYLDMLRAFGVPPETVDQFATGSNRPSETPYNDCIVRFPDVSPEFFEEGRSPRMMTNSNVVVSRLASREPSYTLNGIPEPDAEVRKAVLSARMTDDTNGTDWFEERARAFDDANSHGVGIMEIGTIPNRKSKADMLTARYVPILQHLTDTWCASPVRSRFGLSWFYLSVETAESEFGWKAIKNAIKQDIHSGISGKPAEYVRIARWFDVGHGFGGYPTFMCWIGSIDNNPYVRVANQYDRNPNAYAVNWLKPGHSRPLGQVRMTRMDAEAIHSLERSIRENAENGGSVDILYEQGLDPEDFQAAINRRQRFVRAVTPMESQPFYRIPTQDTGADLWRMLDYYQQRFGASGSVADLDYATGSSGNKTATQIAEESNRLNQNMSWAVTMMRKFQTREVQISRVVAMIADRHPTFVNVLGTRLQVNNPSDPESWLSEWFAEPADVVIDTKAMTIDEDRLQSAYRLTYLTQLAQLASQADPKGQIVDRKWLISEYIKAGGTDDVEKALLDQSSSNMMALPQGPLGQSPLPVPPGA